MKNIIKSLMIGLAAVALSAGCTDKEEPTGTDPYATNFVYLSSPKATSFRATFSTQGVWKLKPEETQVFTPVYCTKPASGDIKVSMKIDESLVAKYNEENGTEYQFLPEVKLASDKLTIKSGEYVSVDSLKLVHTDYESIVSGGTAKYLVPIVVTEVAGTAVLTESRPSVFYFFYDAAMLFAEITNQYTGVKIEDRSGWKIYEDEIGGYDLTSTLTDDSYYTDEWWYAPVVLYVDLGQIYENITNIGIRWYADYASYSSDTIQVEVSDDNIEYKDLGTYNCGGVSPTVLDVYDPQQARYLKITLGEPYSLSTDVCEIYVATAE